LIVAIIAIVLLAGAAAGLYFGGIIG